MTDEVVRDRKHFRSTLLHMYMHMSSCRFGSTQLYVLGHQDGCGRRDLTNLKFKPMFINIRSVNEFKHNNKHRLQGELQLFTFRIVMDVGLDKFSWLGHLSVLATREDDC